MVGHWLGCPPNGYLGSDYGSDVKSLVQTPMAAGLADGLIAKCKQDVPLLLDAPPGMLNVYAFDGGMDRKVIKFEVAGELVDAGDQFGAVDDAEVVQDEYREAIDAIGERSAGNLHVTLTETMPGFEYW